MSDAIASLRRAYSHNDGANVIAERWPPWGQGMSDDAGQSPASGSPVGVNEIPLSSALRAYGPAPPVCRIERRTSARRAVAISARNGALAIRILLSAHFGIRGGKHRMRDHLGIAPWVAGKSTVANIDGLGIPAKQIVHRAEPRGCEAIGPVKAQRPLQPRQCLRGSTCPHQDASAVGIVVGIARIDLERAVDLCERRGRSASGKD